MNARAHRLFYYLIILLLFATAATGQEDASGPVTLTPDTVLAARGDVEITFRDFQAYLSTIPEKHRQGVANSPERIGRILDSLLKNRLIAAQAREAGLDEEADIQARLRLTKEQVLAAAQMQKVASETEPADYVQQAREYYLTHPEEFATPEKLTVRHVLISTKQRPEDEARSLAEEVADKARDGEVAFGELVAEYSEDPSAQNNEGRYTFGKGEMVEAFEEAAFSLQEPGAVAGPVKTRFGYHVIRLEERHEPGRRPFEAVRDRLVRQARERHMERARQSYVNELLKANELEADREVISALRERYRPEENLKDSGTGGQ